MQSEFIESHWQKALQIDEGMRQSAMRCREHFFDESREIESLLDKERWTECETAIDYFDSLAYEYAIQALAEKELRRRAYVELLFLFVIKQSTIGGLGVSVVVRSYTVKQTLALAHEAKLKFGPERIGLGMQVIRLYWSLFGRLPKNSEELQALDRLVPAKSLRSFWVKLWAKGLSEKERFDREAAEAEAIEREIDLIARDWKVGEMPSLIEEEWLYEESQVQ